MSNVITFQPKSTLDAKQNLKSFIELAKNELSIYGDSPGFHWDNPVWEGVGGFVKFGIRATFKSMKALKKDDEFSPAFSDFAKAYIRYKQTVNFSKQPGVWFMPLKALEPALLQVTGCGDVTKIDVTVLDEAAVQIRKHTKSGSARYDTGRRLQVIAEFLVNKQMVQKPFAWKSPFPTVRRYNSRNDIKSKEKKSSKLPSDDALMALAEMFSHDLQEPRDRFTTSSVALLLAAPSRVSELFSLSIHALHEEDGKTGLRWHAMKGGGHDIKYVPSSMSQTVKAAINRLTVLSEKGRELAKWLEANNGRFYRPKHMWNIPDDKPLSGGLLIRVLGLYNTSLASRGVAEIVRVALRGEDELYEKVKRTKQITFLDLDELSRRRLPKYFPYINREISLKWSDALFCMRTNETDHVSVRPYQLWMPNAQVLISDISNSRNRKSIFERHGYENYPLTTHQFRHYLNTLAQKGNVGELDIAKWSGRANIHQNNAYNHMTHEEHVEKIQSTEVMVSISKPLAKIKANDPNMPVTISDLDAALSGHDRIAHITEYGFCVHNFGFSPCQKCMDCLNCSEQVCIKGDDEKLERLKTQRTLLIDQLKRAKSAQAEDVYNADRWAVHQQQTIERVDQLISILESENVPYGSAVRLRNEHEDSPVKRELDNKSALSHKSQQISHR